MPITPEHVGRSYPATEPYRVSRAKIIEFSRALGGPAQSAVDEAGRLLAPPTFAAVISSQAWQSLFEDAELGLALKRVVHADQGFTFHRPLREDDVVTASLTIEKVRNRGEVDMVTVRVDLTTTEGEEVCRATSQLFHTRGEQA